MPVTRSGRVSKDRGQPTTTAQPTNKPKRQPAPAYRGGPKKNNFRSPKTYGSSNVHHQTASAIEEQKPVPRITNGIWASSLPTIIFVRQGGLETDEDTDTIALNLVDYFLQPDKWDPRLSGNVLATSCFLFASKVTGRGENTAERIAEIFGGGKEEIERGFEVLRERRCEVGALVGRFRERLEALGGLEAMGEVVGEPVEVKKGAAEEDLLQLDDEAAAPLDTKASEVDLDSLDFDIDEEGW